MKIYKELIDFVNKDDYLYNNNVSIIKFPLKYNNGYALYALDNYKEDFDVTMTYLCSVDKEGEIIHCNYYFFISKFLKNPYF